MKAAYECVLSRSVVSDSVAPWTVAYQTHLSMGFSRQEYWSELPFSSPGDVLNPGIKPVSPALISGFLTTEPPVDYVIYLKCHSQ